MAAKGYSYTYTIDYVETFVPVAKLNTICVLSSLAVNLECPSEYLDVKNAFSNGKIEEVYINISLGFINENNRNKVCKL